MDFTKKGAVKAQKELVSKLPRNRRKLNISEIGRASCRERV